jgi:hypothetical protein
MSSVMTVTPSGIEEWRNEQGRKHRDDGLPAVTYPGGGQEWWINGEKVREVLSDGTRFNYTRVGLELITETRNTEHRLHSEYGPAIWSSLGMMEEWWYEGRLHRTDGPARTGYDGTREWWLNGVQVSEGEL